MSHSELIKSSNSHSTKSLLLKFAFRLVPTYWAGFAILVIFFSYAGGPGGGLEVFFTTIALGIICHLIGAVAAIIIGDRKIQDSIRAEKEKVAA